MMHSIYSPLSVLSGFNLVTYSTCPSQHEMLQNVEAWDILIIITFLLQNDEAAHLMI